ncbi:MAG: MoxR-like ATPase [Mycobacterium sp.]|nr:MoxR-like ATPase [Mycobacterium sp.]
MNCTRLKLPPRTCRGRPPSSPPGDDPGRQPRKVLEEVLYEVKRVIVGQDAMLERLLVALLTGGHVLLEGVPGLAKTLTVRTLADVMGGTFRRIQFTPDLVPADLVGTRIYRPDTGRFDTELGPVFGNFLLADEINRAPAKVQSALLEVMQERQLSIGGKRFPLPNPFLVMATQNPIEHEGVYPLPEAQRDRFLFKINVGYPSPEEEREIIYRMGVKPPEPKQILNTGDLLRLQEIAANNFVHHALVDYVVRVVTATRHPEQLGMNDVRTWISFGASPRASLGIIAASRSLALVRGRDYVIPQDVVEVIPDVLRHRLVLTYDALADEISSEIVINRVLQTVGMPQVNAVPQQGHSVPPAMQAAGAASGR